MDGVSNPYQLTPASLTGVAVAVHDPSAVGAQVAGRKQAPGARQLLGRHRFNGQRGDGVAQTADTAGKQSAGAT
jgi:hypothetical protein